MEKEGIAERNANDKLPLELCGLHQIKIGGTRFTHKDCQKVTWVFAKWYNTKSNTPYLHK